MTTKDTGGSAMDAGELSLLRKAIEKRQRAHLWIPADAITFIPRVLPMVYGDGRRLFALSTINQRPAYWVIRADSEVYFGEFADEVLTDLEGEFGNGRCGYRGNNLFHSRRERMKYCKCDDCSARGVAKWPMVDGDGGCSWGRVRWPDGFKTDPDGYLLAARKEES